MTLMLASVKSKAEAETVWAGGADIIDLKDPAKGALGPLDAWVAADIVRSVGNSRPISAAAGATDGAPGEVLAAVAAAAAAGADYIKIGIGPEGAAADCVRALGAHAHRNKLVGVVFADCAPDFNILSLLVENGFSGAMLDTAKKGAGRLIDHMDISALDGFVNSCRERGLMSGLAGSLEAPDVPRLLPLKPDYLGFRGSLCQGRTREAPIDAVSVRMIRELIPRDALRQAEGPFDWRLFLARGMVTPSDRYAETDRIFVHDFVLPCAIGAYAFERAKVQDVRFNIDVDIRRLEHGLDDMRGVFSYDLIIDAIKIILGRGHIDLLETLANGIADEILRYPCAVRVRVRAEKLDVVQGTVGIEINRERTAGDAGAGGIVPFFPGNAA